jgi:hypothetical protein
MISPIVRSALLSLLFSSCAILKEGATMIPQDVSEQPIYEPYIGKTVFLMYSRNFHKSSYEKNLYRKYYLTSSRNIDEFVAVIPKGTPVRIERIKLHKGAGVRQCVAIGTISREGSVYEFEMRFGPHQTTELVAPPWTLSP